MAKQKQSPATLQNWINRIWYERSLIAILLWPLSMLFWLIISVRKAIYFVIPGLRRQFSVPVIVVGNITVGGTGKTPMVIYISDELVKLGYKPGVASRGYGADINTTVSLHANHSPQEVGDEPLLIFQRTNVPVVVGSDRKQVIQELIDEHQCDVIICDDGLQDYRFVHDIEIVMIDGDRRFGNERLLPAGPLRERINRTSSCDFKVVTACDCPEISSDFLEFQLQELVNLANPAERASIEVFVGQAVHAVAGIANPSRFFNLLISHGIAVIEHPFPDHAIYIASDFEFADKNTVLITEKDAVKCREFNLSNVWYVPVSARLPDTLMPRISKLLKEYDG